MNVQLPARSMYLDEKAWAEAVQVALERSFEEIRAIASGSILAHAEVLPGWKYCDGTLGTPNLVANNLPGLKWIQKI
jgi:hypothetical protein